MTPLMTAAKDKSPAVVAELLKTGADVNAQSSEGYTSLIFAAAYNRIPKWSDCSWPRELTPTNETAWRHSFDGRRRKESEP